MCQFPPVSHAAMASQSTLVRRAIFAASAAAAAAAARSCSAWVAAWVSSTPSTGRAMAARLAARFSARLRSTGRADAPNAAAGRADGDPIGRATKMAALTMIPRTAAPVTIRTWRPILRAARRSARVPGLVRAGLLRLAIAGAPAR